MNDPQMLPRFFRFPPIIVLEWAIVICQLEFLRRGGRLSLNVPTGSILAQNRKVYRMVPAEN